MEQIQKAVAVPKSWMVNGGMMGYTIDCYVGTEKSPRRGRPRRIFQWVEEDGRVIKGNTEAFVLHMASKFGKRFSTSYASMVHTILRELDEPVLPKVENRAKPDPNSPIAGRFRQPNPDKWVIAH